ncbi:aminoglycoside phosphotransferase family protein [Brachybacterium sp.]|uniref:phosphotransferase enzyme family protein n=1 Tax=Brachybacterium sp. TaxID=1891286 RepID=UPI002ED46BDC
MAGPREISIDGGTVRRPRMPWTPTIHDLLDHLSTQGIPVPRPLSIDDHVESVSLVPGLAGDDAWPDGLSADGARSLGRLLRAVHEGTRTWNPPADAVWSVPNSSSTTICHGDPKPANVAWRNEVAVGLFDWDAARPGDPAEDVAYVLLWGTPIDVDPGDEPLSKDEITLRRARARALLEGYGWEGPFDVVEAAVSRHEQAIDEVEWLGSHGHEPHATWVAQGWPTSWRSRLDAMREAGRRTFPAPLPG